MQRDPFFRTLLWIAAVDLSASLPLGIAWTSIFSVAALGPFVMLTVLRMLWWIGVLRHLLAPARAWQRCIDRGQTPDDAMLLAADESLQQAPRKFILATALGWVVIMLSLAALPSAFTASAAGQSAAALTGISVVMALPALLLSVFRGVLVDHHTALCEMLAERSLRPKRARIRLIKGMIAAFLTMMMGTIIGVTSGVVWYRAESLAAQAQVEQRTDEHEDDSWLFGMLTIPVALMCILPGIVASRSLERALLGPLVQLEHTARQVATRGRLRKQSRVVTLFEDELGDVAHSFNEMLDVLEELAAAATTVAEGDLRVVLERPGDLQDAFRSMLAKLDQTVEQIRMTAIEVAAASAEIQAATQEQEQAVARQSASVQQVSNSVVSLSTSADSITLAAQGVLANAEQTRTTTELMAARIAELRAQAEGIDELLDLIREVANRSDLLALNGSLEAVRAGEAGRGFELVAAEMRRLAERVTGAATDVAAQVAGIEVASASTNAATAESRTLAENTAAAAQRIFVETQRQSQATDQLATSVELVAEIVEVTSRATSHTRSTASDLRTHASQLEHLTRQFKLRGD